ncbi:MAG: M24 family metallopeptidase, partial [Gammaproteobacteria bacterium]|nr:M24 family metallopeptidase [Gammaproteobacteria bacterium]
QECSARVVEAGDMISLDSDLVGPHGYSADISRSWVVGDTKADDEQRRLYSLAHEQVQRNSELFRAGRMVYSGCRSMNFVFLRDGRITRDS